MLITATSGLAQVSILGLLPGDYACFFAALGIVSTIAGQTLVDWLVRRFKKDAVVILLIGAVMGLALVLMTGAGLVKLVAGAPTGFGSLC